MVIQKETISTINDLIETLKDGQEGFRQAAEAVEDPKLKSVFNEYSRSVPVLPVNCKARR